MQHSKLTGFHCYILVFLASTSDQFKYRVGSVLADAHILKKAGVVSDWFTALRFLFNFVAAVQPFGRVFFRRQTAVEAW